MSKRKLDKSASIAQSVAVPAERPPTPDPDVVEGKMTMKEWERMLDCDQASSLAAAVVTQCVDAAAAVLYDKYLGSEVVPHCVSQARDVMNQMLRLRFITVDVGDLAVTPATYQVDDEPPPPPYDNYCRGVAHRDKGHRIRRSHRSKAATTVPAQPKAKPNKAKSLDVQGNDTKDDDKVGDKHFHTMLCPKCRQEQSTLVQLRQQSLMGEDGIYDAPSNPSSEATSEAECSPSERADKDAFGYNYARSKKWARPPLCDLCHVRLGPDIPMNSAISGAVGKLFRGGGLHDDEPTLQRVETARLSKPGMYDSLKAGVTNVSEPQPTDKIRTAQLRLPCEAHAEHLADLEKWVAANKQERQDQIETAGYEDVTDISGPAFPKPVIGRGGLDFSSRYRQVQRQKLDREVEAREKLLRKQAAMESFQDFRARCQRESALSLQASLASTEEGLAAAAHRQPVSTTGLTAAQERALGLDSRGRARMINVAINGRMQRPVVTESSSPG